MIVGGFIWSGKNCWFFSPAKLRGVFGRSRNSHPKRLKNWWQNQPLGSGSRMVLSKPRGSEQSLPEFFFGCSSYLSVARRLLVDTFGDLWYVHNLYDAHKFCMQSMYFLVHWVLANHMKTRHPSWRWFGLASCCCARWFLSMEWKGAAQCWLLICAAQILMSRHVGREMRSHESLMARDPTHTHSKT